MNTTHWHTGHNMPGYLPEIVIGTHETLEDAVASLVEDLAMLADASAHYWPRDEIEATLAIIEEVKMATGPSDWATPDGYVNWITHCTDEACMADLAGVA